MTIKAPLKQTILLAFVIVFLFFGHVTTQAAPESIQPQINKDAFVYILNMGIERNNLHFDGLRNGFAVGDGKYVLTAAHCVADFENTDKVLRKPMIISPYYGDIFEAEIVAVDDVNDIAILRPTWDAHPALELEVSEDWKKSKTILVAGYPPKLKERGGNGANQSQQIMFEEIRLRSTSGKNAREVVVGPCHYPGVGWSGSPFINDSTNKVVGIFCRGDTYQSKKYIFFKKEEKLHSGPSVRSINRLFKGSHLHHEKVQVTTKNLHKRLQFEQILETLDAIKPSNKQELETSLKNLCSELPDSHLVYTLAGPAFDHPNDLSHFEKAIEMAPESNYVHATYGNYLLSRNKFKKAAKQFQIVTKQDPNHVFACHGLLSALVKTDPNAAEVLGKELTARWPENAGFHFEYSKALRAKNKRKEELPVIQKAIKLCDEDNVPFLYQRYLADSLKANKHYDQAEQAYKKLLKTHECEHCWWAYTTLLLDMGPDKIKNAKKARDKTMTFIQDPNTISKKQHIYEAKVEKMLGDPNTPTDTEPEDGA